MEGVKAAEKEFNTIKQEISRMVEEISKSMEGIKIQCGSEANYCVTTSGLVSVTVNWRPRYANDLHDSPLTIREFNGRIILPHERGRFMAAFEPKELSSHEFEPDITSDMKWCWRARPHEKGYFSSSEVADFSLKVLLNLIDRSDKGEIPPVDHLY